MKHSMNSSHLHYAFCGFIAASSSSSQGIIQGLTPSERAVHEITALEVPE